MKTWRDIIGFEGENLKTLPKEQKPIELIPFATFADRGLKLKKQLKLLTAGMEKIEQDFSEVITRGITLSL